MSFTIKYGGDSTHILAAAFKALDDGYDWLVHVEHWVSSGDDGSNEKLTGVVKAVKLTDDVSTTTVTIQPTSEDSLTKIGDPVTVQIDDVTELVIP